MKSQVQSCGLPALGKDPIFSLSPLPQPLALTSVFPVDLFQAYHMHDCIYYVDFCNWLLSFSVSRIHPCCSIYQSLFFIGEEHAFSSCVSVLHSSVDRYWVDKWTMYWTSFKVFCAYLFIFVRTITRNGIVGPDGNFSFKELNFLCLVLVMGIEPVPWGVLGKAPPLSCIPALQNRFLQVAVLFESVFLAPGDADFMSAPIEIRCMDLNWDELLTSDEHWEEEDLYCLWLLQLPHILTLPILGIIVLTLNSWSGIQRNFIFSWRSCSKKALADHCGPHL